MSHRLNKTVRRLTGLFAAMVVLSNTAYAQGQGIIVDFISAPVVANGLVANEPTEFNIILNSPGAPNALALDPANFGHQIPAGGRMEVTLGGSFQRNTGFTNSAGVNTLQANRNMILTINPQNPITATASTGVQHGNWSVSDDGNRKITITPNGGSGDNGLENERANLIGIKVIHLRPDPNDTARTTLDRAPYFNGAQGTTGTVDVKIFNADGSVRESGSATIRFATRGTEIHLTNAGLTTSSQGNPATIGTERVETTHFQRVAPLTSMTNTTKTTPFSANAPYALRFLLFDESANQPNPFIPQKGLADVGYVVLSNTTADLVQDSNGNGSADSGDTKIGSITLIGPGSDAEILPNTALTTSGDGVTGANGSVLNVPVKAGSRRGTYELTVELIVTPSGGESDDDDDDDGDPATIDFNKATSFFFVEN